MFALKQFIATSQHYFVAPLSSGPLTQAEAVPTSYADMASASRLEEAAMALATTLATLTYFTALAAAV